MGTFAVGTSAWVGPNPTRLQSPITELGALSVNENPPNHGRLTDLGARVTHYQRVSVSGPKDPTEGPKGVPFCIQPWFCAFQFGSQVPLKPALLVLSPQTPTALSVSLPFLPWAKRGTFVHQATSES